MKTLLTHIGPALPHKILRGFNSALNYLETGRWLHERRLSPPIRFPERTKLHDFIGQPFTSKAVCYLEFGVSEGYSLKDWSRRLTHPRSQLHGFDSFLGLPENWDEARPKGSFAATAPEFKDPRIVLHQGWFHETLPPFQVPETEQLIIHMDADLYSSTKCVLDILKPNNGAILIFDEFCDRAHELKAFSEFLSDGIKARCLGATRSLEQVAFQVF